MMPSVRPPKRPTYRHGDLRRALVEAGHALAREQGPEAVVLREVTRRAGVVPNAAYRHFASHADLLEAVRAQALSAAAQAMERELAAVEREPVGRSKARAAERARARVRAVGTGYLRFAWQEPGLFRTAFSRPPTGERRMLPEMAGRSGLNPFELLAAVLDDLVAAGVLPQERRPHAEYAAWSAVHGLAMLVLDGPLHGTSRAQISLLGARVLEMVERGI